LVRLICPNLSCRSILAVPISARGKMVRCRACGMRVTVPKLGAEAEPAKPDAAETEPEQSK
jgi:hypothetical protein